MKREEYLKTDCPVCGEEILAEKILKDCPYCRGWLRYAYWEQYNQLLFPENIHIDDLMENDGS